MENVWKKTLYLRSKWRNFVQNLCETIMNEPQGAILCEVAKSKLVKSQLADPNLSNGQTR